MIGPLQPTSQPIRLLCCHTSRCLHVHAFTGRVLNGQNNAACVHYVALEITHQLYVML